MARENQNECAGEEDEKVLTREVATPAAREDPTAVFSHPRPPQPHPRPPETPGFQRLSLRPTERALDRWTSRLVPVKPIHQAGGRCHITSIIYKAGDVAGG